MCEKQMCCEHLEKIEPVIKALIEENEFTEDMVNQINFLEELRSKVRNMYEDWCEPAHFKCKFLKHQEDLIKTFDEFIDELTKELGLIVQDVFDGRRRFKAYLETHSDSEESEESKEALKNLKDDLKVLKDFVNDAGYEIKIVKRDCESDKSTA